MTLRDCPPGAPVLLRDMTAVGAERRRMLEWGFVPGARLRLVARSLAGGLVVALGDARVALDAGLARSLIVEPAW
ncbi:MAG: ferrous iron transport protein A [Actinophytocola sp.]|uniref:FeoA family protein n=1 Tax=Actinophytocola sp. TaxID=1872138 RepID=UPI001329DAD8|nr:FeoA family protein [Actinophytocola sp.]MPZ84482.1 ferrous iron transport protein A [Actinophytocola sp.]